MIAETTNNTEEFSKNIGSEVAFYIKLHAVGL